MSEAPKFKTFRDLRSLPVSSKDKIADSQSNTSITSSSSTTSSAESQDTSNSTSSTSISRLPSRTSKGRSGLDPKTVKTSKTSEVSPTKDFQKIPNSVPRNLEMFRGKSKQVWDYIWHVSRGSINPVRKVRKSRKEIKDGAGLGSMVTVDAAIEHLVNVRLLKVTQSIGSLGGNEYEIFTPEEILLTTTSSTSTTSRTSLTQNIDMLDIPESSIPSITQTIENKDVYDAVKTSFKDNNKTDDEAHAAFLGFSEKISAACERITGKKISKRESDKWEILADLLILELETAARRTDSISSAPAFLTEVLRRKLLIGGANLNTSKTAKAKTDTVGKPNAAGEYEIKPLDEQGRQEALVQLREFADDELLQDFKKWYTEEDWDWIIEELKTRK